MSYCCCIIQRRQSVANRNRRLRERERKRSCECERHRAPHKTRHARCALWYIRRRASYNAHSARYLCVSEAPRTYNSHRYPLHATSHYGSTKRRAPQNFQPLKVVSCRAPQNFQPLNQGIFGLCFSHNLRHRNFSKRSYNTTYVQSMMMMKTGARLPDIGYMFLLHCSLSDDWL
jgi:hypothetical protein